ncbi:MAG: hypothetical protein ACR2GO_05915 [Candidatus Limnocylindria bacterium]
MTARRLPLAFLTLLILFTVGFGIVRGNVLGMGDRFDRLTARIENFIDPPPDRSTIPTVVVMPEPSSSPSATPEPTPEPSASASPSPTSTPIVRAPVDVRLVDDDAAVFASQLTEKDCAVAATQMVLTILGLGDPSEPFQQGMKDRIGEWESLDDSLNGGWGPAAVSLALADYGAHGYEIRAYATYADALRDSAIAMTQMNKPVVMFPWWGAHTWVMTGYRADADPTLFDDAAISGAYILDPWYPRVSSIWGASDGPGNFEDLVELERNWPAFEGPPGYEQIGPGWSRPEGAYPYRDGRFVVLVPTIPRDA